jgi:transcriptional regulator with GAF, ATPase, and Fis domain
VGIVGQSNAIGSVIGSIQLVARSECNPILIVGETGTGKELAARAVHAFRRACRQAGCGDPGPFVAVNCAALTASLLESELFGHVKGAFTGADRDKAGLFELAGAGTIFLDEISEMPTALQAKLLRVLQERTFRRVGGTKDIASEATVITSSNRDLPGEVREGRFRKDLYYRLAIFPIRMPSLRSPDRRDDIPLLARYFIGNSSIVPAGRHSLRGLTKEAERKLLSHDWPGNVRELRNVIERAILLETQRLPAGKTGMISPDSLIIDRGLACAAGGGKPPSPSDFSLETAEREFIIRALEETGWQRTRAAKLLGITRATLHAKLKRYEITPPGRATTSGAA